MNKLGLGVPAPATTATEDAQVKTPRKRGSKKSKAVVNESEFDNQVDTNGEEDVNGDS